MKHPEILYATMAGVMRLCCINKKKGSLGIFNPTDECQCGTHPEDFAVYRMTLENGKPAAKVPSTVTPCVYCNKRVTGRVVKILLPHENGGAYGHAPAHWKCHLNTPCLLCGGIHRDAYGYCVECDVDHQGNNYR